MTSLNVGAGMTADGTPGGTLSGPGTIDLKDSGVTAGTYSKVTVNIKGIITAATTLSASDLPAIPLATGISGTLPVANGGTGATTLSANQLLMGNGTSALSSIAAGTTGQVLRSAGASAPAWSTATYPGAVTSQALLFGSATNVVGEVTVPSVPSVLVSTAVTGAPQWAGGSANTFLRGSGSGVSFGAVDLSTADVTGTLTVAKGGTGVTSLPATFALNGGQTGALKVGTNDANTLIFRTNNTDVATVDTSGRLGIGVSPTATLELKAGTTAAGTTPLKFNSGANVTTLENGAMEYDGTDLFFTSGGVRRKLGQFSLTNDLSGIGNISGAGAVTVAAGGTDQNLTLAGSGTGQVRSTSIFNVTNSTASTSSTTGAVVVAGGMGVAGDIFSGATINAATSMRAPIIYGSNAASGTLTLQSTSDSTKGNILINPNGGFVGIGTAAPAGILDVRGGTAAASTNGSDVNIVAQSAGAGGNNDGGNIALIPGSLTGTGANGYVRASSVYLYNNEINGWSGSSITINARRMVDLNTSTVPTTVINPNGGSVGIGTTTPNTKLQVYSSVGASIGDVVTISGLGNAGAGRGTGLLFQVPGSASSVDGGRIGVGENAVSTANTYMSFYTNTASSLTEKVRIDSAGYVGIGTTSPVSQLHVSTETAASTRGLSISEHYTGAHAPLLNFYKSRGTAATPTTVASSDFGGVFFNNIHDGSAYLTTASFGFKVNGTVATGSVPTDFIVATGANTDQVFANERLRITSAGNVGIGTTGPATKLDMQFASTALYSAGSPRAPAGAQLTVTNTSATTGATAGIDLVATTAGSVGQHAHIGAVSTASGYSPALVFGQSNGTGTTFAERMRIDSTGNVGIGTTNPTAALTVNGGQVAFTGLNAQATNQSGLILFGGTNGGTIFARGDVAGGDDDLILKAFHDIQLSTFVSGTETPQVAIKNNGYVGIGTTTPSATLHVSTTAVAGNIATFVSTGAGGAGCSIAWNGTSCSSDARLKENITSADSTAMLDDLLKVRPVHFTWIKDPAHEKQTGFIAQEIEKLFPEFVKTDAKGYKQVNYAHFVAVLTSAIQQLHAKFLGQQREIASLKTDLGQKANQAEMEAELKAKDQKIRELELRLERIEKALNSH